MRAMPCLVGLARKRKLGPCCSWLFDTALYEPSCMYFASTPTPLGFTFVEEKHSFASTLHGLGFVGRYLSRAFASLSPGPVFRSSPSLGTGSLPVPDDMQGKPCFPSHVERNRKATSAWIRGYWMRGYGDTGEQSTLSAQVIITDPRKPRRRGPKSDELCLFLTK